MQQAETRALEVPLGDGRAAAALGFGGGAAAAEREAWQDLRWEGIPGGVRHAVSAGVSAGFQMAATAGPLCDEPLWGVAFEVRTKIQSAPVPSWRCQSVLLLTCHCQALGRGVHGLSVCPSHNNNLEHLESSRSGPCGMKVAMTAWRHVHLLPTCIWVPHLSLPVL